MIVTLTPNTALDQTLLVPSFALNQTIRADDMIFGMGGKPTDAAWILGEMGIPCLALGFAAGVFGRKAAEMLAARGVTVDFTWVGGETRLNTVIASAEGGQTTITTSTLEVDSAQIDALRSRFTAALESMTCLVIGGSLPRGVTPALYVELIGLARERSIPVIFDADEPNLSAGLAAQPDYVKPNRHELERLTGRRIDSRDDALAAARLVAARYHTTPVVTLGKDGMVALDGERAYYLPALDVQVVSSAGAGDAVLAGLAASLALGGTPEDGLRLGAAAAAAVCLLPATADCRREDIERLLPQVRLERLAWGGDRCEWGTGKE